MSLFSITATRMASRTTWEFTNAGTITMRVSLSRNGRWWELHDWPFLFLRDIGRTRTMARLYRLPGDKPGTVRMEHLRRTPHFCRFLLDAGQNWVGSAWELANDESRIVAGVRGIMPHRIYATLVEMDVAKHKTMWQVHPTAGDAVKASFQDDCEAGMTTEIAESLGEGD